MLSPVLLIVFLYFITMKSNADDENYKIVKNS
jgi:hypothetical protein